MLTERSWWRRIIFSSFGCLAVLLATLPLQAEDPPAAPPTPTVVYREQARWQEIGGDYQKFNQPCDVAVDYRGHIYVADCTLRAVFKFDPNGKLLDVWTGSSEDRFAHPASIAIDVNDVYIVDRYESRVFHFDLEGTFKELWQLQGSDTGQLSEALGICNNPLGLVYIADHNRDQINSYDSAGQYKSSFGATAEGKAKLFGPTDLICDADGNVLTISFNDRLVKFAPDGSVLGTWGQNGNQVGEFDDVRGLAIDSAGNVYVADTENGRIQRLNAPLFVVSETKTTKAKKDSSSAQAAVDTAHVIVWGQDSSAGSVLKKPTGIAVTPSGLVIVSDTQDGSVTLWKPTISEPPPPTEPTPPSPSPSPASNPD